jgi:hypothetical protein
MLRPSSSEPIREVRIQAEGFAARRRSMMRIMATRARDSLWVSGVTPESEFLRDVIG